MPDFDYDAELSRYHRRLWSAAAVGRDDRVLDIGCGTGLLTREAAAVAGSAVGVDISEHMLAVARELSAGLPNIGFELGDVQVHPFPAESFTLAVSRFGTMFFDDPAAAFANLARAMRPGARLVQLVWQDAAHQEWLTVIRQTLGDEGEAAAPAAGGAFSLADPASAERVLTGAGFDRIEVVDVREPVYYGPDSDAACDAAYALQTTQDLLTGLDPAQTEQALERLRAAVATRETADGVWFDSRAWLVTARRP